MAKQQISSKYGQSPKSKEVQDLRDKYQHKKSTAAKLIEKNKELANTKTDNKKSATKNVQQVRKDTKDDSIEELLKTSRELNERNEEVVLYGSKPKKVIRQNQAFSPANYKEKSTAIQLETPSERIERAFELAVEEANIGGEKMDEHAEDKDKGERNGDEGDEAAAEVATEAENATASRVETKKIHPTFEDWKTEQNRRVEEAYERKREELKLKEVELELSQERKPRKKWLVKFASAFAVLAVLVAGSAAAWMVYDGATENSDQDEPEVPLTGEVDETDSADEEAEGTEEDAVIELICEAGQILQDGECVDEQGEIVAKPTVKTTKRTETQGAVANSNANVGNNTASQGTGTNISNGGGNTGTTQPEKSAEEIACEKKIGPKRLLVVHWLTDAEKAASGKDVMVASGGFETTTKTANMTWVNGSCRPAVTASGYTGHSDYLYTWLAKNMYPAISDLLEQNPGQDFVIWTAKNGTTTTELMANAYAVLSY